MWVDKSRPITLDLPPKRSSGCSLIGAISNRQGAMRIKVHKIIPKKDREPEEEAGQRYLEFIKSLDDYPLKPTQTVFVLDGAQIHRTVATRQHLINRGISLMFLPPSSSELNPIEKCKWSTSILLYRNFGPFITLTTDDSSFCSFRLGLLQDGSDEETGPAHPRATGQPQLLPALQGHTGRLSQDSQRRQDSLLCLQEHVAGSR